MGTLGITCTQKNSVLIRWKGVYKNKFLFYFFPFILVNQVVGLCWSIADPGSHLHMEVKTLQWPWAAATATYCSDSVWVTWSQTRPAHYFRWLAYWWISMCRSHLLLFCVAASGKGCLVASQRRVLWWEAKGGMWIKLRPLKSILCLSCISILLYSHPQGRKSSTLLACP